MKEIYLNKNKADHTMIWYKHFMRDNAYNHYRFKAHGGYPSFNFDEKILDHVDLETFNKIEDNRLPLFVATQIGIGPNMTAIPGFLDKVKLIAVLSKSALSGVVGSFSIYRIEKEKLIETQRGGNLHFLHSSKHLTLIKRFENKYVYLAYKSNKLII